MKSLCIHMLKSRTDQPAEYIGKDRLQEKKLGSTLPFRQSLISSSSTGKI